MILLLGGTRMARLLAEHLGQKHQVIYSIAGATTTPQTPRNCQQITGGFGGTKGLAAFLTSHNIRVCIDATHPFATQMSDNAAQACGQTNTPIIQYAREKWQIENSKEFTTEAQLIKALPSQARVFLTIGGKNITPFFKLTQPVIARMIEPPILGEYSIPPNFKLIFSRPPYKLDGEIELIKTHKITHLICKNSGGKIPDKIIAAQNLGIQILMLKQPTSPHKIKFFNEQDIVDYLYKRSFVSPS